MRPVRFAVALASLCAGCGGASLVMTTPPRAPKEPVRLMALSSTDVEFSVEFEKALSSRGYALVDRRTTAELQSRLDAAPDGGNAGLARLKARRIDALMTVAVELVGNPAVLLDKVHIVVKETADGSVPIDFVWTNSWGGMPNSPADSAMRMSIADAAKRIAQTLSDMLGPPGARTTPILDAPSPATAVSAKPADAAGKPWWQ